MRLLKFLPAVALAFCVGAGSAARAEVGEVLLGQQIGAVYLPAMVMESHKLVEKHLEAVGMGSVKVTWSRLGTAAAVNDATLSGSLHFSCQGVPSTAIIWDRTKSTIGVKGVYAVASNNIWLNTRNPNIKSIKDFTEKDRIAIPGLKVSAQALALHRLVASTWGPENYTKLDHIIVSLPHPDALAAVMSPVSEIQTHFATSPFSEIELKAGLKTIATTFDIWGGPTTGVNFVSSEKFRNENPKIYGAVVKAFTEAQDWIAADKPRAAAHYLDLSKEKRLSVDELVAGMNSKDMDYTRVPANVAKMLEFMHQVGLIKTKAVSWKDLYLPEAHGLPGT
ncbi:MAG: ABC transporter substrate-binding protein [Hyphomicrobiaceae bacterium]